MNFEWDEIKNKANKTKHGLDFCEVYDFPWDQAVLLDRSRHADCEQRFAAIGSMNDRLHTVIFTRRKNGLKNTTRIISLRRANRKEEKIYENKKDS